MLRLSAVFGEHMVLQRGKSIAVFGEADGPVEVNLAGNRAAARDEGGRFIARLSPMEAGGPYVLTARCGEETVSLGDVMVGEVWLCGGQSNMEFRLKDEMHFEAANGLEDARVRFYETPQAATIEEAREREAHSGWKRLAPGACAEVSAVAFYAARELAERLGVAVGMLVCCLGGTSASCWLSWKELSAFPEGRAYLDDFEARVAGKTDEQFARESRAYDAQVEAYNRAVAAIKKENPAVTWAEICERAGLYPWPPPDGRTMLRRHAGPYETMLRRVAPYTVRGVFYYQGEQDAALAWAGGYRATLAALLESWRALFEDENLFFAVAQLPRYGADRDVEDWPAIRAAQQAVADGDEHAALACLIDCGEVDNVHPTDKRVPGERLAALALGHVYGQDAYPDAPRVTSATLEGGVLTLACGERLHARGSAQESLKNALHVDGARVRNVTLEPDGIALALEDAGERVRVCYAQENAPEAVFFGESGLPLFPFDIAVQRR